MSVAKLLLGYFLICGAVLSAGGPPRRFHISCESVSITTINEEESYELLDSFDVGCHKSIVRLHDYPYGDEYLLFWNRPLLKKGEVGRRLTLSQLQENAFKFKETTPLFVISSRGFLPGEQVDFSMVTADGYVRSQKFTLSPHPLFEKDPADQATICAVVLSIAPTAYKVWLAGFKQGERLLFVTESEGNRRSERLTFSETITRHCSPQAVGLKGGAAVVTVTRENGKTMSLPLVWGEASIPFLRGDKTVVDTRFAPQLFEAVKR